MMGLSGGCLGMERAGLEVAVEREHGVKVAFVSSCFHSMSLTQVT